ncbi:unnamed protein product [Boreogadus saida]
MQRWLHGRRPQRHLNREEEGEDPALEFMRKFAIGLMSGTISSCVNIPFDVAKSRIQGPQPVPGEIKYRTCFQSMGLVYREEGYLALYKGLVPKIMRLGPGGAVMLLVYEYVSGWLQENCDNTTRDHRRAPHGGH